MVEICCNRYYYPYNYNTQEYFDNEEYRIASIQPENKVTFALNYNKILIVIVKE